VRRTRRHGTDGARRTRRSPRRGRRALNLIAGLLVAASATLVGLIAVGQMTGAWRLAPVLSGSMEPNVPKGAMVVAEQVPIGKLRVGDIMLFNAPLAGHPPVVHRIHQIIEVDGERAFRTKGDANDAPDAWTIRLHAAKVWRVAHVVPYAGTFVGILHEADLRVVVLAVGVGMLTLTGLVAIWRNDPDAEPRPAPRRVRRRNLGPTPGHLVVIVVVVLFVGLAGVAHALFTGIPTPPAPTYASGALTAPSGLKCTWTSASALNLQWTDTSPTFTTGYTVNRGNASGGPYSTTVGSTSGETSTSLADSSPLPPTLRYYVAAAKHGNWSSANSGQLVSNTCIGSINLVAGTTAGFSGDTGQATSAQLSAPSDVAVDSSGNVYIADTTNNRIRKVTASTGVITTIAGGGTGNTACTFSGTATSVTLSGPKGVDVDSSGNVYIADTGNNCIRKVTGTTIARFAGGGASTACTFTGTATSLSLSGPKDVAVNSSGNVYITDTGNNCIRKVVGTTVSQVAGGGASTACTFTGTATSLSLNAPVAADLDTSGNVYIADTGNNCIRKVAGTTASQVAGGGANTACSYAGAASGVSLSAPTGVTIDSTGRVVISDSGHNCVRLVTGANIALMAGTGTAGSTGDNGPAVGALLSGPGGLAAASTGDVWVADTTNSRVRRVEGPL
jgi:signal peptidase I